jgi:hypothetical protein
MRLHFVGSPRAGSVLGLAFGRQASTRGWAGAFRRHSIRDQSLWQRMTLSALNQPDYTSIREPMITVRSRTRRCCRHASRE